MRVLHACNYHRSAWGSDKAWDKTIALSQAAGIDTAVFSRDSRDLPPSLRGKLMAFTGGIYAREGVEAFGRMLDDVRPDVVQTHELYPLVSPWIMRRCAAAGVPVVHTCYDYRLTCPIATHFTAGRLCRECAGGREHRAIVNNCRGNLPESAAYALRNAVSRKFGLFRDVAQFLVLTDFSRRWLMRELQVDTARITIQPCVIPAPATGVDPGAGGYIAYAGRFAFEKGVDTLIAAARIAGLPVRLAGNTHGHPALRPGDPVECVTTNGPADLAAFYRGARMLIVPSLWEETFSIVAAEAMSHGIPVIASRIGALPDTVLEGRTGLLVPPGDAGALAEAMRLLWTDTALCRRLGAAARARVIADFDETAHIRHLMTAYARAQAMAPA